MCRVSVAVVVVAVIGSLMVGCQDRHNPNDVPIYQATGNSDRSSSSSSSDSDSSATDHWAVQARAVDIRPSMQGISMHDLPAVGDHVTVQGDMDLTVVSSIEALAKTGGDFSARTNDGRNQTTLTGHLSRAGGDVDDLYRVQLSFNENGADGTRQISTNVELRPNQPKLISGDSNGHGVVVVLRRPATR